MANLYVLLADDDPEESYLFKEVFEQANLDIQLSQAQDGVNLLSLLESGPLPDLIFVDINMPYKDGVEVLMEIRNNEKFKKLPVIIYSNARNEEKINDCFNKGASMFVVKPPDFDGMIKMVKRIFATDWKNRAAFIRDEFVMYDAG